MQRSTTLAAVLKRDREGPAARKALTQPTPLSFVLDHQGTRRLRHGAADDYNLPLTMLTEAVITDMVTLFEHVLYRCLQAGEIFRLQRALEY
jgi:hypothetical protein